jgi:hypothetical protein
MRRSGDRKAIYDLITHADLLPDLNIRSGESIAAEIAFSDPTSKARVSRHTPSAGAEEPCTASTSAREAGTSAVRSPTLPHRTGGSSCGRGVAFAPRPLRPQTAARATTSVSRRRVVAPPTNQSSAPARRALHAPARCRQSLLGSCSSLAVEAPPGSPRSSTELLRRLNLDE